jgi:biopolymer transport protein ExbB/TolQ
MDHTDRTFARRASHAVARALALAVPPLLAALATGWTTRWVITSYPGGSFVRRLLAPEGDVLVRAIPAATLLLFFWTLAAAAVQVVRIVLGDVELRRAARAAVGAGSLDGLVARGGLLGRLVAPLANGAGSRAERFEVFRHQAELEESAVASRYGLMRLFVWAMPILGFIGTVLGIGMAVGEFSGFLVGDIEDLDTVKRELSKVSTGLSFAFDTTLLGLLSSLVAMVVVTATQGSEESLLTRAEELTLQLLGRSTEPAAAEEHTQGAEALAASLVTATDAIARAESAARNLEHVLQDQVSALRMAIDRHAAVAAEPGPLHDGLKDVRRLTELQTRTLESLAAVPQLVDGVGGMVAEQGRAVTLLSELGRLPSQLEALTKAGESSTRSLLDVGRLVDALGLVAGDQQRAAAALEDLRTLPGQLQTITSASARIAEELSALTSVPQAVDAAVQAHADIADRLSPFESVLRLLHESVERSNAIMGGLSVPLELRIVPTSATRTG